MRIGILTGGGDCPGLNAVIRAAVRSVAVEHGGEVLGFHDGWRGVLEDDWEPLTVDRCRGILRKISTLSSEEDANIASLSIDVLLEEVASPYRQGEVVIDVRLDGIVPHPVTRRNSAVLYGLGNLLENAVDFARSRVEFSARWDQRTVTVSIMDDGRGFSPAILERIGEPFVSQRTAAHAASGGGLGLGLFIAKTLLERSGATLKFTNQPAKGGADVEITWNRADFERDLPKTGL